MNLSTSRIIDVNLNRGVPGIAPLYFRTVVPHVPVALVGVPDAAAELPPLRLCG
mgnify:CR=1 FL=1